MFITLHTASFVWYSIRYSNLYYKNMSSKKRNKKVSFIDRVLGRGEYYDEFDEMEDVDVDEYNDELDDEEYEEEEEMRDENSSEGMQDLQINLVDKGKTLVAQAIVPGLGEDEIDIDLNREMITISAHSNDHCVESDGDYLYEELSFGSFSRSILLPAEVDVDGSKAEVRDGILNITMPKIDKSVRKKIGVKKK